MKAIQKELGEDEGMGAKRIKRKNKAAKMPEASQSVQ